jgi:hypothetical protein
MDPFIIIDPFLHELVLQHFTGSEVLETASLVSPDWSEIVGESKTCMNKVKFLYQVWRHQFYSSTEVFQCAVDSWRRYQHVVVELGVNDDSRQFWKFLESHCGSVVSLKIENVQKHSQRDFEIKFPNLETFRAFAIDEKALITILKGTEKLKDLFVFTGEVSVDQLVIDSLISCLETNKRLEELYLKNMNFLKIFEEELSVKFRLKSLKLLNTTTDNSVASNIEIILLKFLTQQSSSLETFFFEFSSEQVSEMAFGGLPAVTSLGLLNVSTAILEKNLKIKNLEIPFTEDFPSIKKFIDASPNVEALFVANVTNELIDYLAWNFMKLTYLNFKMIGVEVEEYYEALKNEHSDVNQEIEIWDYENVDWD